MPNLDADPKQTTRESLAERAERVYRLSIVPDDVTIAPGSKAIFVAVLRDEDGAPSTGSNVRWRVHPRQAGEGRISSTGEFTSQVPGAFTISAEADGLSAEVTATVEESQATPAEGTPDQIEAGAAAQVERRVAGLVALIAGEPRWDDASFAKAFDPVNHRGRGPSAVLAASHSALRTGRESLSRVRANVTGNRSFRFSVPVGRLPGRGLDLSLDLHYDSLVWLEDVVDGVDVMQFDPDADLVAPGWTLGFGRMLVTRNRQAMLIDGDGTRHGSWRMGDDPHHPLQTHFVHRTNDGSLIEFEYSESSQDRALLGGEARYPDGTVVSYAWKSGRSLFPTRITEPNGNYIQIAYRRNTFGRIELITDTLGRVVEFHYDASGALTAIRPSRAPGWAWAGGHLCG